MKKQFFVLFLVLFLFQFSYAQDLIDAVSLDSIFDEPFAETPEGELPQDASIIQSLRKQGIEVIASYAFMGGINPGWNVYPSDFDGEEEFSWGISIKMSSNIAMNAQISEVFSVRSVIGYEIPSAAVVLGDFYFDYIFNDKVFLRAGKYEQSWGISPNFGFTNLLARVKNMPPDDIDTEPVYIGPSYIMKTDVPVGIGGIQLVTMTRSDVAGGAVPHHDDFAYGGKYNLAFRWADFNIGALLQIGMPVMSFLSVKTALRKTDFYNEWLYVYNNDYDYSTNISFNFGVRRIFFNNKLEINGEYFYNGEENAFYYAPKTDLRNEEIFPFINLHNFALNVLYRYGGNLNLRLFAKLLYASTDNPEGEVINEPSYSLLPGLRITPFNNMNVYFAVPVALGKGYYFRTAEGFYLETLEDVKRERRPFAFALLVTFTGSVQASHYY